MRGKPLPYIATVSCAVLGACAASAGAQVSVDLPNSAHHLRNRVARVLDSASAFPPDRTLHSAAGALPHGIDEPRFISPSFLLTQNTGFPYSANDGALWAGRGFSTLIRAGVALDIGRLRLVLAPELIASENRAWNVHGGGPFVPPREYADRSYYTHYWHRLPWSVDVPYRMGEARIGRFTPGQSSASIRLGSERTAEVGIGNENYWWGPGIRNALVLSSNAPGFPHAFARLTRPAPTRFGHFEAQWMLGGLTESAYFDSTTTNNLRAISAAAVAWHAPESSSLAGLTIGISRAVYGPVDGWSELHKGLFSIWSSTSRSQRVSERDTTPASGRDQVSAIFFRWVLRPAGLSIHAELGRTELPISLRDALLFPEHTLGRTIGAQWARRLAPDRTLAVEAELTNIEQSPTLYSRPIGVWYASRAVPQGYTHQGQILGASIGPSGSSQWLAIDYLASDWSLGLNAQRIRWNSDYVYIPYRHEEDGFAWCHNDVTLSPGARGSWKPRIKSQTLGQFSVELLLQNRLNFFFQNLGFCPNNEFRRDLRNRSLTLSWTY